MAFDSILPITVSAKAQLTSFAFQLFFFYTEAVFRQNRKIFSPVCYFTAA